MRKIYVTGDEDYAIVDKFRAKHAEGYHLWKKKNYKRLGESFLHKNAGLHKTIYAQLSLVMFFNIMVSCNSNCTSNSEHW